MAILKVQKRPVETRAVKVEATADSIIEALTFMGKVPIEEDAVDKALKQGHLKLKTPESGGETQNADFGDYIVEGYTKGLGKHYWPVKGDYMETHYNFL